MRDGQESARARVIRATASNPRSNSPNTAHSTTSSSNASPSARLRLRSRRAETTRARLRPLARSAHAGRAAAARATRVRIISNMGAANPRRRRARPPRSRASSASRLKVAAVTGDDVLDYAQRANSLSRNGETSPTSGIGSCPPTPISARARSSRRSRAGADIVLTGRVGRPLIVRGAVDPRIRLGDGRLG